MRHPGLRLLLAGIVCGMTVVTAAETAPRTHRDYRRLSEAAYARKDYAAARSANAAALRLRPDSPRYRYNAAAFSARAGDEAAALAALRELASLGVFFPAERDPDFATLQGKPGFLAALRSLAANREPRGALELRGELPGRTGIIEGIAFRDRTGEFFLGDVHYRCIWRRDARGQVTRFTAEDEELLGIFGIAIDERRNTLWATMTALPEMAGYTAEMKGQTGLAEFNLATSDLRRVIPVPGDGRDHGLGDLVLGADGTVYATDSLAPVIWKYSPEAEEIEKFVESSDFSSLQGLAFVNRVLIVSDYDNGLFAVEAPTADAARASAIVVRPLAAPAGTTLVGLDGLLSTPLGLVATQNGTNPQRIVLIALATEKQSPTAVTILASGQPALTDLTLLTLANGQPTAVAGSGWEGFDPTKSPSPRAHMVRLVQAPLP